jgi:hypothetical protein
MQFWGESKMPLDINGQGSISGITSLNTSASVTLSETELGYLDGVTSGLQTQINTKANSDSLGLVKIVDQSFTSASAVSVNNCFSSNHTNYRLVITGIGSAGGYWHLRFRQNGTDDTQNLYWIQEINASSTSVGAARSQLTFGWFGGATGANGNGMSTDIFRPFVAVPTAWTSHVVYPQNNAYMLLFSGRHDVSTSYDGITITPNSGTITGNLKVYGYRD